MFLFHGSGIENWYSILRNGVRNLSYTGLMTAGAASGSGVYSAFDFGTSNGYSMRSNFGTGKWAHSTINNEFIIGIIEVIKIPEYCKGGIYVIPNDDDIQLRYII